MHYSQTEKYEIIQLIEQSDLGVNRTLRELIVNKTTFYNWYNTYVDKGLWWRAAIEITIQYIQPGKPAQNAYIERFNRTFREDVLDAYLFGSIQEVNAKAYEWQIEYNQSHPCKGLNGLSPWLYIGDSFLKEVIKE